MRFLQGALALVDDEGVGTELVDDLAAGATGSTSHAVTVEYGDGKQWKRIYEFNKDVIANPNRPKKGTKIQIPIE